MSDDDFEDVQAGGPAMTDEEIKTMMLEKPESARVYGQLEGAAVAFGFTGMGWAIKNSHRLGAVVEGPYTEGWEPSFRTLATRIVERQFERTVRQLAEELRDSYQSGRRQALKELRPKKEKP